MFTLPREYVVKSVKSWGRAVSGPVLGVAGIVLLQICREWRPRPGAFMALIVTIRLSLNFAKHTDLPLD
jgi:hypothetical protein